MTILVDAPLIDDSEVLSGTIAEAQTAAAPFIDGGWVFGGTITIGDTEPALVSVEVGATEIAGATARRFRDPHSGDPGSWSFTLGREDPDVGLLDYGDIVRFRVGGQVVFEGVFDEPEHILFDEGSDDEGSVVRFSGAGTLAEWGDAYVGPSRGVGALPIEDVRTFSLVSPDFDTSALPNAKKVNRQREYANWRAPLPHIWPDITAFWIWANLPSVSSINAPVGACWFFTTFTLAATKTLRIFGAGDNSLLGYLDGAEMTRGQSFTVGKYFEIELSAGTHYIAVRAYNQTKPVLPNPGGIIMAGYTVGDAELLDELVFSTDATWKCLPYPTTVPGFTWGQVLRILLEEAQADGALTGWTLGFTDTLDSNGEPWEERTEITLNVGRPLDQVLREAAESSIDVHSVAGRQLRAYNYGTSGRTSTPGVLTQTDDALTSDYLSLRHTGRRPRLNRVLIRYGGGHTEATDSASITAYGSKGDYLEMGAMDSELQVQRITNRIIDRRAQPSYATVAKILPKTTASTPYMGGWGPRDWISSLDVDEAPEQMRVRVVMMEDEGDTITWTIEGGDELLEAEEAHEAWLRRMVPGALLGGAQVSSRAGTPEPASQQITALRVAKFSFDNEALVASLGPRDPAEASGNMVEIVAELTTAGSTATVVRMLFTNGVTGATTTLGSDITLPAGEASAEIPLPIPPVRANIDKLQCEIVTVGTGAEGLVVQVRAI